MKPAPAIPSIAGASGKRPVEDSLDPAGRARNDDDHPTSFEDLGGGVIEEDVAAALESGKLAGYGNDVWYSDPPENSPLTGAPNVVLLPHIGASSKENLLRIGDIIVETIEEFSKK